MARASYVAGAAGTVGYDAFTGPAKEMEATARAGDATSTEGPYKIADALDDYFKSYDARHVWRTDGRHRRATRPC